MGRLAAASAFAIVIGCGAPPAPRAPAPSRATVQITAASCIDPATTDARLLDVLAAHRAMNSGLRVEVVATPIDATTDVHLRVVRLDGDVGLDRHFPLAAADCASAAQLLALSVDRWLSAFPEWAEPPLPPPPPAARWTELHAGGAVNAITPPLGAEVQAIAIVDHGARVDRFGGSVVARGSVPQRAGRGRFQQTSLLVGASWRHASGRWEARLEGRGGVVLVSGIGFAENSTDWLPWWEGAAFAGRRFGWGVAGIEIAATALQHRAVTRDGLVSEDIPLLRIGVAGVFGLRAQNP